jgi:hypothetical protein
MPATKQKPAHLVTVKFYDQDNRIVYLRLPPDAHWFICTSKGLVDPKTVARLFAQADAADLPPDKSAVFTLTTKER